MNKRITAVLAALLVGTAGAAVAATPAQAAETDCFSGKFCLWNDSGYSGALYMYSASTSCTTLVSQNNQATSVYNRSSRSVRVYDSSNCTGSYLSFYTGEAVTNLRYGYGGVNWNDRVSSFKQV